MGCLPCQQRRQREDELGTSYVPLSARKLFPARSAICWMTIEFYFQEEEGQVAVLKVTWSVDETMDI